VGSNDGSIRSLFYLLFHLALASCSHLLSYLRPHNLYSTSALASALTFTITSVHLLFLSHPLSRSLSSTLQLVYILIPFYLF
jgi:hypothetical protein